MIDSGVRILLIIAPLYFANASALLFGGKTRLDRNKTFRDGSPLLGAGKTFRGTGAGILAGIIVTIAIYTLFSQYTLLLTPHYLSFGVLLTIGSVLGDIAASFIKRRLKGKRGQSFPVLDQLDFVVGGLLFASFVAIPPLHEIGTIVLITLVMHVFTNWCAFKLKLKSVPW
jgi:CDP-2,3-bis-(O-geranylgeranyl)-sn-glycerol synthase